MSKFRLSNHRLMIEKGRHNILAVHNRKCPFCFTNIEDETHFSIRVNLMEKIDIRNEYPHTDELLSKFLMLNEDLLIFTANFITGANDVRDFLLEKHRNRAFFVYYENADLVYDVTRMRQLSKQTLHELSPNDNS